MNTPCEEYLDSDGSQLTIKQMGFEWKDYWTYGLRMFRYVGRTYFLHSRDDNMRELSYLSYITPKNEEHIFCGFDSTVLPVMEKQSTDDGQVCEEAIQPYLQTAQTIKLSETIETPPESLNRPATEIQNMGLVDIDNDGVPEKIVELLYASGGGRGCSFNYYEILNDKGDTLSDSLTRRHFLAMQDIDETGFEDRSCSGISNRLFQYQGKIYYEHNIDNNEVAKHTISQLKGSTPKPICEYRREIRTKTYPLQIPEQ
jgi:hypothetical protein